MTVLIEPALIILERDRNARALAWSAWWGERILCRSSPQPEHDACRALLVLGYSGKIRTRHQGAPHDAMTMGIAWGAQRSNHGAEGFYKLSRDEYDRAMAAARRFLETGEAYRTPTGMHIDRDGVLHDPDENFTDFISDNGDV